MRNMASMLTSDLETMYRANSDNADVLGSLLYELGFRQRPKAARLKRDVEARMRVLSEAPCAPVIATLAAPERTVGKVQLDWLQAPRKEPGMDGL